MQLKTSTSINPDCWPDHHFSGIDPISPPLRGTPGLKKHRRISVHHQCTVTEPLLCPDCYQGHWETAHEALTSPGTWFNKGCHTASRGTCWICSTWMSQHSSLTEDEDINTPGTLSIILPLPPLCGFLEKPFEIDGWPNHPLILMPLTAPTTTSEHRDSLPH